MEAAQGVDLDLINTLLSLPRPRFGDNLKVGDEVRVNGEAWIVVEQAIDEHGHSKFTFEPASRSDPT